MNKIEKSGKISKIQTNLKNQTKLKIQTKLKNHTKSQCLKITVKVAFNIFSERPNLHFVGSAEPMPNHDLSGRTDAEPMPNLSPIVSL